MSRFVSHLSYLFFLTASLYAQVVSEIDTGSFKSFSPVHCLNSDTIREIDSAFIGIGYFTSETGTGRFDFDDVCRNVNCDSDGDIDEYASNNMITVSIRQDDSGMDPSLSIEMTVPWYKTRSAIAIYLLTGTAILYLIFVWQKKMFKKQREKLVAIHEKTLKEQAEKHQKQMVNLQKEKFESEFDQLEKQLKQKTIELAKKAKENEEKNRLLKELKSKIVKIQNNPELAATEWKEVHHALDSYINREDRTFEIQIDELHQELYQRLAESFPELTVNDLRLCAYLKLGFTSKEIAEFMSIQPSSVYISRSRLRKKLDLDREENLHNFLNTY